jgi:hypothetical protein
MWKDYVDIFSALLTPTIALITTYIAIQQYRRERAKFRHELYDRRMAVYKAASKYLAIVVTNYSARDSSDEERKAFLEFQAANAESPFLFDQDVAGYLGLIHMTGATRFPTHYLIKHGEPSEINKHRQILAETTTKHREHLRTLQDVFMKYLDLKNLK